jgi:hypothetical protein
LLFCRKLREEVETYRAAAAAEQAAEARREENKKVRHAEAEEEKPNPVEAYLDMLAAAPGEDAWKDGLLGMGTGSDIPKLFRCTGKVRPPFCWVTCLGKPPQFFLLGDA